MVPTARRGEVLLMRRFDLASSSSDTPTQVAGKLDDVFNNGVPCAQANKAKDMFPIKGLNMGGCLSFCDTTA